MERELLPTHRLEYRRKRGNYCLLVGYSVGEKRNYCLLIIKLQYRRKRGNYCLLRVRGYNVGKREGIIVYSKATVQEKEGELLSTQRLQCRKKRRNYCPEATV